MAIDSKQNLSDKYFRQVSDETLNLSGDTIVSGKIRYAEGVVATGATDFISREFFDVNNYTDQQAREANEGLESTGNILLDRIGARTYNEDTPATGDITIDTTGSVIGGVGIIDHNDSVAPNIIITPTDLTRHKIGDYVTGVLNVIWFAKRANKIEINYVQPEVIAPDITAPEFTSAPTATNIQETSFDITATLNENGTVYGYLLANGATAPTLQEIIDNSQDSFIDSGSGGTLSFTGLVAETDYDVYLIAEDEFGNRQAESTLVGVLTQEEDITEFVVWEQLTFNVTSPNPGQLTLGSGGDGGYGNGGYSTLAINGNNSISFRGKSLTGQGIGLTNTYSGIASDTANMDIWVQLREDGDLRILEDGTVVQETETWVQNSVITIRLLNSVITIEKDGSTIYTSAKTYTLPLTVIGLLRLTGATIFDAIFENANLENSPL